ncbi:MAG: M20 family metallopeptidase [Candidatus Dormibacteria bacterium]
MSPNLTAAKGEAQRSVAAARPALIELSHRIHANPELAFEEVQSSTWLAESLTAAGFDVERLAGRLSTAFIATMGTGPLHIAICAEYDALPAMGHACGHNIIAASAVGAGIGLGRLADDFGLTVQVIGTPAEELGDRSGKILLLEHGAFRDVHAGMMVHPSPYDIAAPNLIASTTFDAAYTGKEAHAAAWPELGINAADALTVAQVAIGLLRQHILATDRVHGIITKGGDAANIVPAHTSARYKVRSERVEDLERLRERVIRCFEAGATGTGALLEITGGRTPYAHVEHDAALAACYQRNAESLGRTFVAMDRPAGSTDMGNVSLVVPTIHPFIGIDSSPAVNHQPEFAACCVRPGADQAIIDGAVAMAWTALDIAADDNQRARLLSRSAGSA